MKEKKEKSLQFRKNVIRKKKMNFERTLFDQTTYPGTTYHKEKNSRDFTLVKKLAQHCDVVKTNLEKSNCDLN
jgi:hypothetical protein